MVGACVEYAAHQETCDVALQVSSAGSRDAILHALDNMRMPSRLSKRDLVATFSNTFRIILSDTLDLSSSDYPDPAIDECELDALDSLACKLRDRQIIHRVSDGEMMRSVSQIIREALDQDGANDQFGTPRPSLYVFNCSQSHFSGASQLRASKLHRQVRCPFVHKTDRQGFN